MKRPAASVVIKSVLKKPAVQEEAAAKWKRVKPQGRPKPTTIDVLNEAAAMSRPVKPQGRPKPTTIDVLNEASLAKLEGKDISAIDRFVDSLEDKDQQRLWKKFQACREIEGSQENYKQIVGGPGGRLHANKLLRVYLQSGCTTKAIPYITMKGAIENRMTVGSAEKWQPLHYMLSHKYGPQELKARVIAGTIKVRACPSDSRFPEFLEITQYKLDETNKTKLHSISIQEKSTWDNFSCLANLENEGQQLVFSKQEESVEEPADPAEFAFGKKIPAHEKLRLLDVGFKSPPQPPCDRADSVQSLSSCVMKQLEASVSLSTCDDPKKLAFSMQRVKKVCNDVLDSLENKAIDDKTFQKKANKKIDDLKKTISVLQKAKDKGSKPAVIQAAVNQAAAIAKSACKLLDITD